MFHLVIKWRLVSFSGGTMMDLAFLLIVVLTTVLTSPIYADVPRCDKNNPDFSKSPFCFPDDYNMDIVPASDGPLHVNVDIFVFEVNKYLLTFHSHTYWRQSPWQRTNFSAKKVYQMLWQPLTQCRTCPFLKFFFLNLSQVSNGGLQSWRLLMLWRKLHKNWACKQTIVSKAT